MARVVRFAAPGAVEIVDELDPSPGRGEVRVETLYSGISAGTELSALRGSNPYLHRRWDPSRRLFLDGEPALSYPLDGWGYEEVGRVVELGADAGGPAPGTLVWGAWGHRRTAVVSAERASARVVPDAMTPLLAVFARIGAIALNAVLDAEIAAGDVVAVFGLGPPGLIAVQLAALDGATVVAVDRIPRRLEAAQALGAAVAVDFTHEPPAEAIKELTRGRGADVSIEVSGSYSALGEAIRATAYNSSVVAAGFYQGDAAGLRLGDEFHHNRIRLVSSQISGVNPRLAHRWDALRLEQTVMRLAGEGKLRLEPLVSHVVPFEDAAAAFQLLAERPEETIQVVLDAASAGETRAAVLKP